MEPDSCSTEEYLFDNKSFLINWQTIDQLVDLISSYLGLSNFETSVSFVSDKEIKDLNSEYRNKDKETDVLSFPLNEWTTLPSVEYPHKITVNDGIPQALGDIIISPNTALYNANKIGQGLDREVCFLLVHSILHLCGYDHMESIEEKKMIEQQQKIMKLLENESPDIWAACVEVKS